MNRNICRFLLLLFWLVFPGCGSEAPSGHSSTVSVAYKNFIADFGLAEKILPIQEMNLSASHKGQLGEGWAQFEPESGRRWAEGLESTLYFKSPGNADMELTIVCEPLMPDPKIRQVVHLRINGHDTDDIPLKSGEHQYTERLPAKFFNRNKGNRLIFAYAYAKKPSDYPGSSDSRSLAVKFKQIRLAQTGMNPEGFLLEKKEGKILQSPDTRMNFYYRVPAESHLLIKIDHLEAGAPARIILIPDNGDKMEIKMDKAGTKEIPLKAFSGKVVEFSFDVMKNPEAQPQDAAGVAKKAASWSEIAIMPNANATPRESAVDTAALAKFKSEIKNLDVIYLVLDAFNANHSSLYGYPRKTTPFLDSLGKKGIVLDHFYANHPYTLASVGTMLTSKYSYEHGLIDKINRLNPIFPTLPEILADHGMPSFLITGHRFLIGPWGLDRGFKKVFFDDFKIHNVRIEKIKEALSEIYGPEFQNQRKWIYLHMIPPHEPYTPPKQYCMFNKPQDQPISVDAETLLKIQNHEIPFNEHQLDYIKSMYDANVRYADDIAEKIIDFLRARKITEKSIIIITSDHGEAFMEHGFTTHNSTIYEEMTHVPFIISLPDRLHFPKARIETMASTVDIAPTIMDILGLDPDPGFNGTSLLPKLFGATNNKPIYMETLLTGQVGLRDLDYQLISKQDVMELYNLSQDPLEKADCFDKEPIIAGFYLQQLNLYNPQAETGAARPQVDINALDQKTRDQLKELGYIK